MDYLQLRMDDVLFGASRTKAQLTKARILFNITSIHYFNLICHLIRVQLKKENDIVYTYIGMRVSKLWSHFHFC